MNDILMEQETPQVDMGHNPVLLDNDPSVTDNPEAQKPSKGKPSKKKLVVIGSILILLVVLAIAFFPSKLKRVENKCCEIADIVDLGDNYFQIDTYPEFYFAGLDESAISRLHPQIQENALEAIRYANKALGFSDAVYLRMMETSAIMGRQSEENDKFKISWTYSPKSGLEVTYEEK